LGYIKNKLLKVLSVASPNAQ